MTELIGDPCIPSELIVPVFSTVNPRAVPTMSGAMWISGANLYYVDANGSEVKL